MARQGVFFEIQSTEVKNQNPRERFFEMISNGTLQFEEMENF